MLLNLDASTLICHLFVLVVAFTVHEYAHAWTADHFGDLTPSLNGRLTLNPLAHLDPIGSLLLLIAGFGWAKPVPINPSVLQRRSSSAVMWVSVAGVISNLIMALVAAIPFRMGLVSANQAYLDMMASRSHFIPTLPQLLFTFIEINLLLMLFNLIPLYPLDGEKAAQYFFPPSWNRVLDTIRPYSSLILLAIVFLGVLNYIIGPPLNVLLRLLIG